MPDPSFVLSAAILGVVAVVAAALRKLPGYLGQLLLRHFCVTVILDNRSELFAWVLDWFDAGEYSQVARVISVAARQSSDDDSIRRSKVNISPGPGIHLFRWRGCWTILIRELTTGHQVIEVIRLYMLSRDRDIISRLVREVSESAARSTENSTVVYGIDRWAENWQKIAVKKRRALQTVIIDSGMESDLITDIEQFLDGEERYLRRGVPWRRGYLLCGPPGTGKTSLIFALAGRLRLNICAISLADGRLTDHGLVNLLHQTPIRSIFLIEDIDSYFHSRDSKQSSQRVSFSGLLNALDGVASQEGRVLFITTNHPELLDPALMRPGRIDRRIELGRASRDQARRLFLNFFPEEDTLAEQFAAQVNDGEWTPAVIQRHLQAYEGSAVDAASKPIFVGGDSSSEDRHHEPRTAASVEISS
jgi:chaperone BCS1